MSGETDPSDFRSGESASDFERDLQRVAPKSVRLDLSVVDQCVVDPLVVDRSVVPTASAPQWQLASTSWLAGLATGLLVAILGGGAFRTQESPTTARVGESSAIDRSQDMAETKSVEPLETKQSTELKSPLRGWSNQVDYLAEFSPANIDLAHRMEIASRGLLVSFRIADAPVPSGDSSRSRWADGESQSPANLGDLRKQMQLEL